jgi:hypothetical protein
MPSPGFREALVLKTVGSAVLLAFVALPLCGQTLVDNGIDDRIEALNAVFAFRNDLSRDGTLIARCPIPTAHRDTGTVVGLESRFQQLLVRPDSVLTKGDTTCSVFGFADRRRRVLWLQDLVEVRKTASSGFLPPYRSKQFEITFQFLRDPGYREFHRYVVEPSGITTTVNRSGTQIAGWRVLEYKLVGWDFHWGDNVGHGSGVRLP